MSPDNRADIIKALSMFEDNDFARVFDKWHFYFNKQSIMLTNVDIDGKFIEEKIRLKPELITQVSEEGTVTLNTIELSDFDKSKYNSIFDCYNKTMAPALEAFDYKENQLTVKTANQLYTYDQDEETIIVVETGHALSNNSELHGKRLGCGKIQIKSTFKKATSTTDAKYVVTVELTPDLQKDYEIIPYSPNEEENRTSIAAFMAKYVSRPFEYLDNTVGVEINFNKVFYKPEKLEPVQSILDDLDVLENELKILESNLRL
jgi:type I restriction enzyme M protein